MTHLPAHPTIIDPCTGEPLRAIGVTSRGPIWPVMGGDGTGDPASPADPPAPTPAEPPAEPAKPRPPQPADPDGGKGGKSAILAELAKERDARQKIEDQFAKVAAAFGVEAQPKGKTDIEALTERIEAQERRAADAEARAMRAEIAQETGLPARLAARLVGSTKEELAADAADLIALLKTGETPADGAPSEMPEPNKPKAPAPDPSQGAKGTTPPARPTSLFDAIAKAKAKT